jgi:hypothetical protein
MGATGIHGQRLARGRSAEQSGTHGAPIERLRWVTAAQRTPDTLPARAARNRWPVVRRSASRRDYLVGLRDRKPTACIRWEADDHDLDTPTSRRRIVVKAPLQFAALRNLDYQRGIARDGRSVPLSRLQAGSRPWKDLGMASRLGGAPGRATRACNRSRQRTTHLGGTR